MNRPVLDHVERLREIAPIETEWEALASRLGASPFSRAGWFACWLESFGPEGLEVVAVRREGRLAAVLPVLSRRGVIRSVANWHTPSFAPLAEDAEAELSLFSSLFDAGPRRVDLSFLPPASAARLGDESGGRRLVSRTVMMSPYVAIEGEWSEYWRGLSRNHRGNVSRRRRRLAERGTVSIDVFEGGEELSGLLEESFRIEASGWKGKRGTAVICSPQTRRFYEGIAAWAARLGLLRLATLRLDGRLIAFNLDLEAERRHYLLKLGHDAALNQLSPGTVLTAAMVERAFALGLKSYEFLGGKDTYKLRWSQACREAIEVQVFDGSPLGMLDRIVQTHGRAAVRRVLALRRGRTGSE